MHCLPPRLVLWHKRHLQCGVHWHHGWEFGLLKLNWRTFVLLFYRWVFFCYSCYVSYNYGTIDAVSALASTCSFLQSILLRERYLSWQESAWAFAATNISSVKGWAGSNLEPPQGLEILAANYKAGKAPCSFVWWAAGARVRAQAWPRGWWRADHAGKCFTSLLEEGSLTLTDLLLHGDLTFLIVQCLEALDICKVG